MASSQRKVLKNLLAKLQKRYSKYPAIPDKGSEVLKLLIFAIFFENSPSEACSRSMDRLEEYFIDWNEIRVSTAKELAELFAGISEPVTAGERVRRTLQWLFDHVYKFDLEDYRTRPTEEFVAFLETIPFATRFVRSMVQSLLFKMQDIPLDEGMMRVFRLLDIVEIDEQNREYIPGLATLFTQSDRLEFFCLLHELGSELMANPESDDVLTFLETLDPEVRMRTWIPLVESNEVTDPVAIARELSRSERKQKQPLTPFTEEFADLLDEQIDEEPPIDKIDGDPENEEGADEDSRDELGLEHDADVQPIFEGDLSADLMEVKKKGTAKKAVKPASKENKENRKAVPSGKSPDHKAPVSKVEKPAASNPEPKQDQAKQVPPKQVPPKQEQPKQELSREKQRPEPHKPAHHTEGKPEKKAVEGRRRTPTPAEPPNAPSSTDRKSEGLQEEEVRSKGTSRKVAAPKNTSANAKVSPVKKLQQKKPR